MANSKHKVTPEYRLQEKDAIATSESDSDSDHHPLLATSPPPQDQLRLANNGTGRKRPRSLGHTRGRNADLLKYSALVILVLQNSALVLTLRYSRTMTTGGPMYIAR